MKEELKYELIERYLSGDLSGQELTDFKQQLDQDTDLKAEVELHRDIEIAMLDKEKIPFINRINNYHEEQFQQEKTEKTTGNKKIARRRIISFAVAIAAVLLLAFFGKNLLVPDLSPAQLSENTIGSMPSLSALRSTDGGNINDEILEKGFNELDKGNYSQAITYLQEIPAGTEASAQLGIGYAYMQEGNYEQAISIFNNIRKNSPEIKDTADWYLAHTYLRQGKKADCVKILKNITLDKTVTQKRQKQAFDLLKSIEK